MNYLTRKQVSALKRALHRRGMKLPRPGMCKVVGKPGKKMRSAGPEYFNMTSAHLEICHTKIGGKTRYYMPGRGLRRG